MKINKTIAVSDNGFIFNPLTGDSFSANSVGSDIINLMKEGKDIKAIKEAILKKYDVTAKDVEKDMDDFMSQLKDYYLLNNE